MPGKKQQSNLRQSSGKNSRGKEVWESKSVPGSAKQSGARENNEKQSERKELAASPVKSVRQSPKEA